MNYIKRPFLTGACLTLVYLLIFLCYHREISTQEMAQSLPFIGLVYFALFTIGNPKIQDIINKKDVLAGDKSLIFPILLWAILLSFIGLHGENPFKGAGLLLLFLLLFPVLYYRSQPRIKIGRIDYIILLAFVIPLTLVKLNGDTTFPMQGNSLGSLNKITWVLSIVYVFSCIRQLKDVGFYPIFKLSFLGIALISWLTFIGFVCIIAWTLGFMHPDPFSSLVEDGFAKSFLEILRIWIGTAIFEELFFRGILQNMLAQQINTSNQWKSYWVYGFVITLLLSILVGYSLDINYIWFPTLITLGMFTSAYFLEKRQVQALGTYTALAIISMVFGIAHYHKGSILFVGLAAVAGWAYGYTYLKTKNVFYAALVHSLVNFSEFLFQLHDIK
jgi:membrane protease YdiL (CAAX protease family)